MLIMFPKFTPIEILPAHFQTVLDVAEGLGLTQVSQVHVSFLAWRNEELVDCRMAPGFQSQLKFEPTPTLDDPHHRTLRGPVELRYGKVNYSWAEHPKWHRSL